MKNIFSILLLLLYSIISFSQVRKTSKIENSKPFVLGQIETIPSKILGEKRILNIYLPDDYNPSDSIKYPVIYLLDGSSDEDFIHIVGLVQYCSFEWVNQVPKSIVVGIATVERRRDFTFPTTIENDKKKYPSTGNSAKFISFIEKELQPFVEKKFKTTASKTIIGQSLGGLLETEILFKKPTLFNKYIIISPSLWWDNGSLLKQNTSIVDKTFTQETEIYIGVGKEGETPTEIPRIMEQDANLLAEIIKSTRSKTVHVLFDYLPQENHATIMHQAVLNAFKQFSTSKK